MVRQARDFSIAGTIDDLSFYKMVESIMFGSKVPLPEKSFGSINHLKDQEGAAAVW